MSAPLTYVRGQGAARPNGTPPPQRQVLLLASGRSGQGTSTTAALLGAVAAADGQRVLLVDAAGGERALATLLGVPAGSAVDRHREGSALLEELLLPVSETLSLLTVGAGDATGDLASVGERRAFFRWLAPLYGRFDLVIIDGGSRLDPILETAGSSARAILVTGTDRVALAATYALLKTLDARHPGVDLHLLLNASASPAALAAYREVETAAQLFLRRTVNYAGALPDDEALRASAQAGIPVQQAPIDSPVVDAIHQLAARLRRELSHRSHAVGEPRLSHWR